MRRSTIPITAGTISRACGARRRWCSRSMIRSRTAARAGPRTRRSRIRPRRPMRGRAKALRSARWRFFDSSDLDRILPRLHIAGWINRIDKEGIRADKAGVGLVGENDTFRSALVAFESQIVLREIRESRSVLDRQLAVLRLLHDA